MVDEPPPRLVSMLVADATKIDRERRAAIARAEAAEAELVTLRGAIREKGDTDGWVDWAREKLAEKDAECLELLTRAEAAETALECVTIPTARFLDPPDGGDVPITEQVSRMYAALMKAEMELDYLREREKHFAEVLGVADGGQYRNDWDARIQRVLGDLAALKAENERLRVGLLEHVTDNLWNAYHAGFELDQDKTWIDGGMSDAEWLQRELGLERGHHDAEMIKARIPELAAKLVARTALETTNG